MNSWKLVDSLEKVSNADQGEDSIGTYVTQHFGRLAWVSVIAALISTGACETSASNSALTVQNDADLLISRCGKPDREVSTAYDDPRPPIPTRILEYRKAHLKVAFFPGGDARLGDPPPYQWKFMGIVDTRTQRALTAKNLQNTLQHRLPCYLGKTEQPSHI